MYTYPEEQLLAVLPKFTAFLGLPSALFVVWEVVVCDHRNGRANPISRALAGMCAMLSLDALGWFLSTWAVPKGSWAYAAGNQASCSFQGFLLQAVIGAPMYSCAMAFYFYLVVKHNVTPETLARVEKYVHAFIMLYSFGSGFFLLGMQQYNQIGTVCWVIGSPAECGHSSYQENPDVPCERGDWAWVYGVFMFYGVLWICILGTVTFNVLIYVELRRVDLSDDAKWVAREACLYCLAFCVSWTPSTLWSVASWSGWGGFWLDMASAFFEPLAGFWNLQIFLRNRKGTKKKLQAIFCCERMEDEEADNGSPFSNANPTSDGAQHQELQREQRPGRSKHQKLAPSTVTRTSSEDSSS